jgi:hypothetical protein
LFPERFFSTFQGRRKGVNIMATKKAPAKKAAAKVPAKTAAKKTEKKK